MSYLAKIQDREFVVGLDDKGKTTTLIVDGAPVEFRCTTRKNKHRFLMLIDSKSYDVEVNRKDGKFSVFIYGREFEVTAEDERLAKLRKVAGLELSDDGHKEIISPMPGLVSNLIKNVGDQVSKGEGVIIIEAMKMENELKSQIDGEIAEILVKPGQSVDKGECLVRFK